MHSNRVLHRPVSPQPPGMMGRPLRLGGEFAFGDLGQTRRRHQTSTRLYDPALAGPRTGCTRLTHHIAWTGRDEILAIPYGTIIRLQVEHPMPADNSIHAG